MVKSAVSAEYKPGDFLERPVILRAHDMEAGTNVAPHRHKWGQLAYASEGIIIVSTEDGRWMVPPERAVWIPPDIAHAIDTTAKVKIRNIHIAEKLSAELPTDCRVVKVSPLLRELVFRAETIPKSYEPDGREGRIMAVILDQISEAEPAPLYLPMPEDKRLMRLTGILLENPSDNRTLSELSELGGASERTMARLFLKETGLTFGKWRQQRRLLAALELLSQGRSVTAIAFDLGYDSVSAFIAMFKAAFGTTPSRYFQKPDPISQRNGVS
jgi:AraC-like DNA-binding protein